MRNTLHIFLLASACLAACVSRNNKVQPSAAVDSLPSDNAVLPTEFTPHSKPKMTTGYLMDPSTGAPVIRKFEDRNGLAVVDGDIVLGKVSEFKNPGGSKSLQFLGNGSGKILWTGGVVPYVLAANFPNRDIVEKAIGDYSRTKIKFVPRTAQPNYIEFTLTDNPDIGGQSTYGMQGGRQFLWLNQNTNKWTAGTVIHELGHALSVAHEQMRSDRDQFVTIVLDNVVEDYKSQFQQLFGSGKDVGPYDYASIMHYPSTAFSKNGKATIVTPHGESIGQREKLSKGDIAGVNNIYSKEIAFRGSRALQVLIAAQ